MALTEWLRQSLEDFQAQQGYCLLLNDRYATIRAKRVNNATQKVTHEQVHYLLERRDNDVVFTLLGGVTGYESWSLYHLIYCGLDDADDYTFCACAGSRDRWDELWLNSADVWAIVLGAIDLGIVQID